MSGDTVGYTYQAQNLCPSCTRKAMWANGIKVQNSRPHEDAIRKAAEKLGIDAEDQHSCDFGNFPKPITARQCETKLTELPDGQTGCISDEQCTGCGNWLVLGQMSPSEAALARYVRDSYELPHSLAKMIAVELRKWGLSHPAYIKEENARQAAAMFPHDFAVVTLQGCPSQIVILFTPQADGDRCFYCEKPWEDHVFTCSICGIDIPATDPHRHQMAIRGERKLPMVLAP
jgi:hypothetical protein